MYAIRQRSTGFFLPELTKIHKTSGGYSHQEPQDKNKAPPRLFTKEISAKRALQAWLQGKWTPRWSYDSYGNENYSLDVVEVRTRDPKDMEVVEVDLVVKQIVFRYLL